VGAAQASGSIRLLQRRRGAIPGRLSAGHPWPAMLCSRRMLPSLWTLSWLDELTERGRCGLRFRTGSLAGPEYSVQASGSIRLLQRRRDAIPGRLSAGHPWPARLCSRHMLPSLWRLSWLDELTERGRAGCALTGCWVGSGLWVQHRLQEAYAFRKDAGTPSLAGSARAIPGPRCFAPGVCFLCSGH